MTFSASARELGYGLRRLRRQPRFAAAVLVCLTLGVAASATTTTVADAFFFRPPVGVADAARVVRFFRTNQPGGSSEAIKVSYPQFAVLKTELSGTQVAAYAVSDETVTIGGERSTLHVAFVSPEYFAVLGTRPVAGRLFGADASTRSDAIPIVLSDRMWRRHFRRRDLLAARVNLRAYTFTVIGVAPPGFTGAESPAIDCWIPLDAAGELARGREYRTVNAWWLTVVAHLRDAADQRAAETAVATVLARPPVTLDPAQDSSARVIAAPLAPGASPALSPAGRTIKLVAAAGSALLLIAALNIGGLFMLRGLGRQRDLAIRRALGASPMSLLGDVLAEVAILAAMAGLLAFPLVITLSAMIAAFVLPDAGLVEMSINARTCGLIVVSTAFAGAIGAALASLSVSFVPSIVSLGSARSTDSRWQHSLRAMFVAGQVAATTALVGGALVIAVNLASLRSMDLGLSISDLVLISVEHTYAREHALESSRLLESLESQVKRLPGVTNVSRSVSAPFLSSMGVAVNAPDHPAVWQTKAGVPYLNAVTETYFKVTGMHARHGRTFSSDDASPEKHVAVINETFAKTAWPADSSVGKCLILGADSRNPCYRIVGVVPDARRFTLVPEDPSMQVYIPLAQNIFSDGLPASVLLVKVDGRLSVMRERLSRLVAEAAPVRADIAVTTLEDMVDPQIRPWRTAGGLWRLFALAALVVTAFGVYGALAHSVALRRRDLAIKRALGANLQQLMWDLSRRYYVASAVGVIAGIGFLVIAARRESSMLDASPRTMPAVAIAVACIIGSVVIIASLVPVLSVYREPPGRYLGAD